MRLPFLAAVMVVTCIIFPRVHAEEKLITLSSTIIGGTVEEESGTFPPGTASLCGTSGLSITAVLGIFGNNFPDADVPLFPETTQIFGGTWGGGDVRSGVVTLRGKTYETGLLPSFAELFLNFRSEAVAIPPLGDVPVIVQAPFTFFGFFTAPNVRASLSGGGVGTLVLQPHPTVEGAWASRGWQLEFSPADSLNAKGAQCGADGVPD